MAEAEERAALVAEAQSWLGTPYHPCAKIKGEGVDCLTLVVACFENVGLIPPYKVPHYPPDWHLHSADERYENGVREFCNLAPPCSERRPRPADVVLWRIGRSFAHGVIAVDWPLCIHAQGGGGVVLINVERERQLLMQSERVRGADPRKRRASRVYVLKRWTI